jgi:flagellin
MALAIATNNAALNAAASASSVNRDMETSMARLSSGKRINSASDDAAGVAISSRLSAEIRGTDQAIRNALDGQALIDTAEGAHSEIENILQRMREVSVQAANDTNNNQDRANLQAEMSALVTEIDRIAGTTTWAGEKLMEAESGTKFSFQVGAKTSDKNQIEININGMGAHALGLQADSADVQRTLSEVIVGQSINTVDYDPALQIRQGSISSGVVTANNGNTSITLPMLGAIAGTDQTPAISTVTSANDTITLNAAALTAGFTLTLDGTNSVIATAGETTAQLVAKINAETGSAGSGADHSGHGYSATAAGDVITLHAQGEFVYDGSNITTGAGGGTLAGVSVSNVTGPATLGDVTYDTTNPSSINAAAASINAVTGLTNITATVGADGSNNAGKIVLDHNTDAAAGIGEHGSLDTVFTAYDTANSAPAATISVNGQEGILSFHEDAGTAFKLVLARVNSTGAPQETFTIDTTADLQTAVDAINGTAGAGTTAHGYTASIVAAADGSPVGGTIKLTSGSAHADNTQVSFSSLDLGRIGDTSQTMPLAADGVFDATTGVFIPGNVNTSGTVNLTLGDETLTIDGISNKGADASGDAAKIASAINAGNHGYTAAAMTGADTGKVKITQPAAPTKDMDVNSADKARESIVAIDQAIQTVNIQRSSLGAVSNRLSHTINNLTNISSNLSAAQGGIEDADFAHETTMLAKNQILQQASTAMLAQANASKQNVLSLLQG